MTVTGKTEGEQCSGESREEVTQRVIQGLNCSSFSNFLATVSASRRSAIFADAHAEHLRAARSRSGDERGESLGRETLRDGVGLTT